MSVTSHPIDVFKEKVFLKYQLLIVCLLICLFKNRKDGDFIILIGQPIVKKAMPKAKVQKRSSIIFRNQPDYVEEKKTNWICYSDLFNMVNDKSSYLTR